MILFLILLFAMASLVNGLDCPISCQCSVVENTNLTVCQESGFKSMPSTIDRFTNFLDLSGNQLSRLENYTFSAMRLVQLVSIDLRRSGVRELGKHTFAHLRRLKILDLSENFIVSIDSFIFADNKALEMVNFSGNPIVTLNTFQFTALPSLKSLDFRNCRLQQVESDAFSNLIFLETLNLGNNSLASMPPDVFTWLPNLKNVELHSNPWKCDCDLQMLTISLEYRGLYSGNLSCLYDGASDPSSVAWHAMDNVSEECIPLVQDHMKDMLIRKVSQSRAAIVFSFMNTTARFSSQIVKDTHVPWLLVILSSTVVSICVMCVFRICSRMRRRSKLKARLGLLDENEMDLRGTAVYRDYAEEEPSTSYHNENFSLIDEYSSSEMSVSIDL